MWCCHIYIFFVFQEIYTKIEKKHMRNVIRRSRQRKGLKQVKRPDQKRMRTRKRVSKLTRNKRVYKKRVHRSVRQRNISQDPTQDSLYMNTYVQPMTQVLRPLDSIIPEINKTVTEANEAAKANNAELQKSLLTKAKPNIVQANSVLSNNISTIKAALAYSNERKADPKWNEQATIWNNWVNTSNSISQYNDMITQSGV